MNFNHTLTCSTCGQNIDARFGMSARPEQPFSFACPICAAQIRVTFSQTRPIELVGVTIDEQQAYGPFDNRHPFVDLHLDFPVMFGEYEMGMTPYIKAMGRLGDEGIDNDTVMLMGVHGQRLWQLDWLYPQKDDIRTLLRLYKGNNKQLFLKRAGQFLRKDLGDSLAPQDLNNALYTVLHTVFLPFLHHEEIRQAIDYFTELLFTLIEQKEDALQRFMVAIVDSGFLKKLQGDCLELYPAIFATELPMRPALFLDLIRSDAPERMAARVSAKEFKTYKDLFKDLAEVYSRQLILVAAINNIINRGDHNSFAKPEHGAPLSSLEKFAEKTLSDKFKYFDDPWYPVDKDVVDPGIRNAIAHFTTKYDEIAQLITYFPDKGGLHENEGTTITFLAFMSKILVLFREVHRLHHLIKCIFYYEYLVRNKQEH